jgi:hypothetical protein
MTLCREMTAQTAAGGITDLEFLDQDRIVETTPVEIAQCLGVVIELLLIESGGLFNYRSRPEGFDGGNTSAPSQFCAFPPPVCSHPKS